MKILLSIHQNHMENIFAGIKKFEFRKVRCNHKVETIVFYVAAPTMKVAGEAKLLNVVEGDVERVWEITHKYAGISYDFYRKYYKNQKHAVAYGLGKITRYATPLDLADIGVDKAPQSFQYLK